MPSERVLEMGPLGSDGVSGVNPYGGTGTLILDIPGSSLDASSTVVAVRSL